MPTAKALELMTVEEYLRTEETSPVKREYVDGRIFAMTGANRRHNIISGNIFSALHSFLSGTPCRPFIEAMKARVKAANCFYYPDVMVACDKGDLESVYTEEPVLIIEVLSHSTAAVDRREKLVNYMKIPTLREYIIVHQRRRRVQVYRKGHDGRWSTTDYSSGDQIVLESLPKGKLTLSFESIYRDAQSERDVPEVREEEEEYELSW